MVTVDDIRSAAPEFAVTPSDDVIQLAIDEASAFVAERAWGSKTDIGVKYLALHLLTMQQRSLPDADGTGGGGGINTRGAVTFQSDESLSVRFASPYATTGGGSGSAFSTWLSLTDYGQRYLFFSSRIFAPRVLVPFGGGWLP